MRRSSRWILLLTLVALLTAVGPVAAPAGHALAAPQPGNAPAATWLDDEIIVLDSAGRIVVSDPYVQAGGTALNWNSGGDLGWQGLAAGDVDGDGYADLVTVRAGEIKVWGLRPNLRVIYNNVDTSGKRQYRLLTTGDFDKDNKDEIIAAYTRSDVSGEYVDRFDRLENDGAWSVNGVAGGFFGSHWQDMTTGDLNNDGYDDLILVRQSDNLLKTYLGPGWSQVEDNRAAGRWAALAAGNLSATFPGDELAMVRQDVQTAADTVVFQRWQGMSNPYADVGAGIKAVPNFIHVAVGDVNGDGEDEAVAMREVPSPSAPLVVFKPVVNSSPQTWDLPPDYWKQVQVGDLNGDGKDEIVALRGDLYRAFTWNGSSFPVLLDKPGSYYVTQPAFNLRTLLLANLDGRSIGFSVSLDAVNLTGPYGQQPFVRMVLQTTGAATWTVTRSNMNTTWLLLDGQPTVTGSGSAVINVAGVTRIAGVGTSLAQFRVMATLDNGQTITKDIPVTFNVTDPGLYVSPSNVNFAVAPNGTQTKAVVIDWPALTTSVPWTAAVVPVAQAAQALEQIQSGAAKITEAGIEFQEGIAAEATWATLDVSSGTVPPPVTINVTAHAGPQSGLSQAVLIVSAVRGPNDIVTRNVTLNMFVGNSFHQSVMPVAGK